ncbi:MAG: hypothetical protein N2747_00365 [Chitinophagaceae bacterium]|nr:hypothetical protein [Chitinophagaceae bacterium]
MPDEISSQKLIGYQKNVCISKNSLLQVNEKQFAEYFFAMALKKTKTSFRINQPEKYEHAFLLFMENVPQNVIAQRVGVTAKTITEWKEKGNWEAKRLSRMVSVDSLINGILQKAEQILNDPENFNADALAKALAPLKTLKSGNTADEDINAFTRFGNWLIRSRVHYSDITDDFIKKVTKYQDLFIKERIAASGKFYSL